jgi:hypothetical protein
MPGAPPAGGHQVLIDSIHAHNFLDKGLEPGNRDYHSLFGPKDALAYLARQGFEIREITTGTLNEDTLAAADTLFINLVSDNLPPFLVEEIFAIKDFIEGGGNVLVITDHSNAYHHSWKLMPLFTELGIRLYNESALEVKPRTLGPGAGWILIENFKPHPITENLSVLSFHSGGTVDENGAVAFLSATGWGDTWATAPYGENSLIHGNRGNYGNFKRDPLDRSGPLGVVLAREIGQGKFVVVGDQNALGNLWLRFGDNYKLYLNIFRWFSDRAELADYSTFGATKGASLLMLDNLSDSRFGDFGDTGLYHAYAYLSRYYDTYIHCSVERDYDLIIVSPSVESLDRPQIAALREHLKRGKNIIVAGRPANDQLFTEVEKGLVLLERQRSEGKVLARYRSGARLEIYLDFARFNNEFVAEPTHTPTTSQRIAASALREIVDSLLPRFEGETAAAR